MSLLESLDDPLELEALYRQDPESFRDSLDEASRTSQDSMVLRVWKARLEFREPVRDAGGRRLWWAVGIGVLLGALVRIPAVWLGEEWYYPRLAPSLVILALAAYFWLNNRDRGRLIAGLALTAIVTVICVATVIHITVRFRTAREEGLDSRAALLRSCLPMEEG